MKWNTNETTLYGKFGGHQFAFNQLTHNKAANYNYFYTSNLSLKKSILTENMFDPWFDGYGWEDMELGYRLEKNLNLTLIYNSNALVYHHHEINLNEFKNRMISIGQSIHLLHAKHPEISNKLSKFKLNAYKIISQKYFILTLSGINKVFKNKLIPLYFYCLSKKYFLIGYKNIPSKLKINEN
jgi:hypothetical protein